MEGSKKSNTWLVVLLILILGAAVGFGVYKWSSMNTKNDDKTKSEQKAETDVADDGISNEVKATLGKWVNVASDYNGVSSDISTLGTFAAGITSDKISAKTKLIMAYNSVMEYKEIYKQEYYILTADDISKMEATIKKSEMNNEDVNIMKISDFDSAYKELFGVDASYTLKDLNFGCPTPWGMDKSQDRIYLFHRCGGTSPLYSDKRIESYETDENGGYSIHQTVDIRNSEKQEGIEKTYKILWKFDKDLKFVSSEKE